MLGTANPGKRRVFTFGVGVDLNAPLLASIARTTGGREDFVLPGADVEVPVASLARRLEGVVAVNPKLVFADPQRVDEVLPSQLPDWFAGDQILVLGRYRGTSALMLSLEAGVSTGPERKLATTLQIDPSSATTANGFVPRLWASRRIASLTESLRALGADSEELPSDSRTRELIDEIVRLSLAHGILSEYTAFLADESAPSPQSSAATSGVRTRMEKRLIQTRSGAAAVNQELNAKAQREAPFTAKDNRRLDAALAQVAESKVQQIADKTFQLRGDVWQDADAPADGQTKDVEIGTPEFDDLVDQLVSSNRQSILGLPGEVLISQSGQLYRIRSSKASTPHTNP
jgi:Ca-activated chloride channel family protein